MIKVCVCVCVCVGGGGVGGWGGGGGSGQTGNVGTTNAEMINPLKYLSKFWRTLEISLSNCEINLQLK